MNTILNRFLILTIVFVGLCFTNCSKEDGGGSVIGNSYKNHYFYLDEDGWGSDDYTIITFKTSSTCEIKAWGYDYVDYEKERYSWTLNATYKISGNVITIIDSPLYYAPTDQEFINRGSYLEERRTGDLYYKQ